MPEKSFELTCQNCNQIIGFTLGHEEREPDIYDVRGLLVSLDREDISSFNIDRFNLRRVAADRSTLVDLGNLIEACPQRPSYWHNLPPECIGVVDT